MRIETDRCHIIDASQVIDLQIKKHMKQLTLLTILIFALPISLMAQRVVALHSTSGASMYSSTNPFVDAYNDAVDGDTVYLPGGAFTPPSTIDKQLTIIGVGYHPDSTTATFPTLISGVVNIGENADNCHLEGIEFGYDVKTINQAAVENLIIKRCKINGNFQVAGSLTTPSTNFGIIETIFGSNVYGDNLTNSSFNNCFFTNQLIRSSSNVVKNSIFFRVGSTSSYVTSDSQNTTYSNNIFVGSSSYVVNGTGNIVYNNIFVHGSPNLGSSPISNGNYFNVPQVDIFVNQTGNVFDYTHDYHLQDPATYLGTDGSQVGIYGGVYPYKAGAVPFNPHIRFKNIAPQTDNNGELSIEIHVGAQNN